MRHAAREFAAPARAGRLGGMSITPEALEQEFSLPTAATRLDFLSRRDNGATTLNTVRDDDDENGWASFRDTSLDTYEALELLALGEVVSRKAHDSQLIGIRAALRGGASWEQIAEALGVAPESAWDSFNQAVAERLDADDAAAARNLAGARPSR
jgi:alkylhydroperoxidase/carboxymuconolactone decarboxylase family protein YurZ